MPGRGLPILQIEYMQLRLLLALETFTRGEGGWREAGTDLLARYAGLAVNTAIKARGELVASGAVEYRPGNGRGHVSAYRIKIPNIAGDLSTPERYPSAARKGTQTGVVKVPKRNAVTSGNISAVLEASVLEASVLPVRARGPAAAAVRRVFPGAREDEIEKIISGIKAEHRPRDLGSYVTTLADNGDLRLPCDRHGTSRHSDACRHGDGGACYTDGDWCECRCHTQPAASAGKVARR
jgi:hypothetical protein